MRAHAPEYPETTKRLDPVKEVGRLRQSICAKIRLLDLWTKREADAGRLENLEVRRREIANDLGLYELIDKLEALEGELLTDMEETPW
jgi:hypothetical protein